MVLSGPNNIAYNNIVRDAQGTSFGVGVDIHGDCVNCKVYSNTIYNNHWFGINVNGGANGTILQNNIIFNNGAGAIQDAGTSTTQNHNYCNSGCTGTGTINSLVNPFVSAISGDFHLVPGSTAINAGATLNSPYATDFANTPRPQGTAYDLGAYEFIGGIPPVVTIVNPTSNPILGVSVPTFSMGGTSNLP